MLQLEPSEFGSEHQVSVIVQQVDGYRTADADLRLTIAPSPSLTAQMLPIVMPIQNVPLLVEGEHSVEIVVNQESAQSLPFFVELLPVPGLSPAVLLD